MVNIDNYYFECHYTFIRMATSIDALDGIAPHKPDKATEGALVNSPEQFARFLDSTLKAFPDLQDIRLDDSDNQFGATSVLRKLTLKGIKLEDQLDDDQPKVSEDDIVIMQIFDRNDPEGTYYRVYRPPDAKMRAYYDDAHNAYYNHRSGGLVHSISPPDRSEYTLTDENGKAYKEEIHYAAKPNLHLVSQTGGKTTITSEYTSISDGRIVRDRVEPTTRINDIVTVLEDAIKHGIQVINPELENQVASFGNDQKETDQSTAVKPVKTAKRRFHLPPRLKRKK